jgi:uncharacterized membrane protein
MNDTNDTAQAVEIPLTRVQILCDVIFASSMTIMVFSFDRPDLDGVTTAEDVTALVIKQLPVLVIYMISFVLIAIYWLKHLEHFSHIESTNTTHLWLQLAFLAAVAVIPFSNSFMGAYPNVYAVQVFYGLNLVLVGLFSFLSWKYATHNHRLVDPDLDDATIKRLGRDSLTEPCVALLALAVSAVEPRLWEVMFTLVPLLYVAQNRFRAWRRKRKGEAGG